MDSSHVTRSARTKNETSGFLIRTTTMPPMPLRTRRNFLLRALAKVEGLVSIPRGAGAWAPFTVEDLQDPTRHLPRQARHGSALRPCPGPGDWGLGQTPVTRRPLGGLFRMYTLTLRDASACATGSGGIASSAIYQQGRHSLLRRGGRDTAATRCSVRHRGSSSPTCWCS